MNTVTRGNGLIRRTAVVVMAAAALAVASPATATIINVANVAQLQTAIGTAAAGDTILLAPGTYQIVSTLTVVQDVTMQGDTNLPTVLDGGGNPLLTLLTVTANNVKILNLTLQNAGTAIDWQGSGGFTVTGVTITGTTNVGFYTQSSDIEVAFTNSTVAHNNGRGIEVESIPKPVAPGFLSSAPFGLTNVTVSHNGVGMYSITEYPWGVENSLIVANGSDCMLPSATLGRDHSIDSDGTCQAVPLPCPSFPFCVAPVFGLHTVPLAALGLDLNLGANGGPTLTEAINSVTSPAVDTGNPDKCPTIDQRGFGRSDGLCDIGAFEFGAVPGGNTPLGSSVLVLPMPGLFSAVTVTFEQVTVAGNTTVTIGGPPPPSGFKVAGVVYDISTTAAYQPGKVTICLPYDPANPNAPVYHYQGGAWVPLLPPAVDSGKGVVCGDTYSLSPFAILVDIPPVPFASFTARVEIERSHSIKKHGGDSFEIDGRAVLGAASNGIAPDKEDVTVSFGSLSLTIPAGSFVKKADKDDDHGKMDRDDRVTAYRFKGVIAGVSLSAEIEQGPKRTFRFEFEGRQANLGLVMNPVTVGLAIGDDAGHAVVKADIDK